ncbi:MAG TPA: gamma-glutamylcyclotransferase [Nocardioidaceae bacterium]|jgi:gamma-glutamylcyclotransferase (GGCT)/AIG2-like uncharacterized protein YtfP|nr:gamma-glutamylcyclotransferase [Nocardioidaceae bacterium]
MAACRQAIERGPPMVYLMTNGEGMRGGSVHHTIADQPFVGERETAPKYRFFSVRDEFPGILPAGDEPGAAIRGELYDVSLEVLRDRFVPDEPPELELSVVELADGSAALSMVLRPGERERHKDITEYGGWRAYRRSLG